MVYSEMWQGKKILGRQIVEADNADIARQEAWDVLRRMSPDTLAANQLEGILPDPVNCWELDRRLLSDLYKKENNTINEEQFTQEERDLLESIRKSRKGIEQITELLVNSDKEELKSALAVNADKVQEFVETLDKSQEQFIKFVT